MLCTEDLDVSYNGQAVLRGVSLSIERGKITALVGPSGSGKTSFLQSLNRLLDLVPGGQVAGRVLLDGKNVYGEDMDVPALRLRVGQIFQKPNPFPSTIRKNIQLALRAHGCRDKADLDRKLEQALRAVGLWDEVSTRLDQSALSLSGGQQQRLCIARAIALEPDVLLMDEPCSALDPLAAEVVEELISGFRGRYTVVIVTHNLAQARRLADQVAVFWPEAGVGQLVEVGATEQVFGSPRDPRAAAYVRGSRG